MKYAIDFLDIRVIMKVKELDIRETGGGTMAREKLKTLTEQMFYLLLCLHQERRGMEILERVQEMTGGRVRIGSGTLYDLLELFVEEGMIRQTRVEGRRRIYLITDKGKEMLERECQRLRSQLDDYDRVRREEEEP